MPTGYTSQIAEGQPFKDFVLTCARGMGALVMMRDDPLNAPIPERFDPSPYYLNKLEAAREELTRCEAMTEVEADSAARADYAKEMRAYEEYKGEKSDLRAKYQNTLAQLSRFALKSAPLASFREFMVEQVQTSLRHDCDYEPMLLLAMSGKEHREMALRKARQDVEYSTKEHAKEVQRVEERNAWLVELRAALKEVE